MKKIEEGQIKVIFDTNIFVSTFCFGSQELRKILLQASDNCEFCFSAELAREIFEKFDKYGAGKEAILVISRIIELSDFYDPEGVVEFPRDPKDAFLLELAEAAEADFLVTGDKKHLLPLKNWRETKIVTPRKFSGILKKIKN
jgi:hypothetical protein